MTDAADVAAAASTRPGLRLVRFLWCGNDGTVRAKASALARARGPHRRAASASPSAMQAMNALDQLQPVEGMGPVGEIRLVPDPDDVPRAAVRAAHRRDARRPRHARRRAGAAVPALVPEADGGAPRRARRRAARGRVRERVLARRRERRRLRARRLEPLLLDDRDDRVAGLRRRRSPTRSSSRASRSSSTTPSSATASRRSRPRTRRRCRPPTSRSSCARRSAASRREHGLVASLAPKPWPDGAGNGGHIHFSLWEGERNRFHDAAARRPPLGRGARVPRRRARAPPRRCAA